MSSDQARLYRLTRPDGLGFFRRHSATQFALGCLAIALGLVAIVVHVIGLAPRIGLGLVGLLVLVLAVGRTPSGEDLLDVVGPAARFGWRHLRHRDRWAALLVPFRGDSLPPLFAGISLVDVEPNTDVGPHRDTGRRFARTGLVVDRADGSVSVVLRVHGEGFLLSDPREQDDRVAAFGSCLASLGREGSGICRVAWSQFSAPALFDDHHSYLHTAQRDEPDIAMRNAYLDLLDEAMPTATSTEVLVTLTATIAQVRTTDGRRRHDRRSRSHQDRLLVSATRLSEEARLFAAELDNAGLTTTGPLPAGAIAKVLRERLDPSTRPCLSRRGRTLVNALGLVTPDNGFPLCIEEHPRSVRTDDAWHRILRVAEWPRSAVRADWLASFLSAREVTRNFTVVFVPQPRRLARRQALAVATRVGASIDERESKGRRVGAEERRAQFAAEALDEELEAGAEMELVLGLVDVCANSATELEVAREHTMQVAADVGLELRNIELRQAEALVACLPIGRLVLGRAK